MSDWRQRLVRLGPFLGLLLVVASVWRGLQPVIPKPFLSLGDA